MTTLVEKRLQIFPVTARIEKGFTQEILTLAGCDLLALTQEYGTPLYLYDQATMDLAVEEYQHALRKHYPAESGLTYAGKAYLCTALAQWVLNRGLWLDCTGAGELHIARNAGLPRQPLLVHGVNKSLLDLQAAFQGAGTIVVDHLDELQSVAELARTSSAPCPDLWLRLRPGLAVDTHVYNQTGGFESKFGMSLDEAAQAVHLCLNAGLPLTGLHFHLGSKLHDPSPLLPAIHFILDFVNTTRQATGWMPAYLSPGGGWGVPYHEDELPHPPIEDYVRFLAGALVEACRQRGLALPKLQLEPGRSLIARAGIAIYTVGAMKHAGGRRWLLLDGGLADNPRPALYGARYTALPVRDPNRPNLGPAWLGGPYCESGDVLIQDLELPEILPGERLAVPASGAYHLSMSSNYNGACRPAVLWLAEGRAWLIQRRESLEDLVSRDWRIVY